MKTLLFFFLVALHATVCLAQPKAGVVSGRLIVKFKPAAYEQAVQTRPAMRTQGVTAAKTLTIGLAGIDKLNEQHKAVSMYRLFPYAGKHEAMQQKFDLHLWYAVVLDESFDPREVAGKYIADNDIEWAEPMPVIRNVNDELTFDGANPVAPTAAFPNDPHYGKQWHYENTGQTGGVAGMDIRLPQAWNITKGNPQVVVGIVDSGVDVTHDDLKGSLWVNEAERDGTSGVDDDNNGYIDDIHGFNFTSGFGFNPNQQPYGPAPIVASEHGSHVAGTIAATTNNATGVAGIAGGDGVNRGARLMVCQTMTDEVKSGHITAAIAYAANNGAAIIQNSWSIGEPSTSIRKAIQYFIAAAGTDGRGNALPGTPMKGGIAIFAAGNDNISLKGYPASYEEVLAVAATNHYGRRSYYSNYGDWVDISAPGGDVQEKTAGGVYSTLPGNRYDYFQGTSMACPHVSGVAALVLSCFGSETYTPDLLRDQLLVTAMPLLDDPQYQSGQMGSGLINAFKAVSEFVPVTGITLPANHSVQVGRTDTIYATILPADATNQRIQWTSSSPGIAAINEAKGIVTGVVEGAATITATTRDGGFAATTTVNVLPVLADSIRLAPQRLIVNQDATTGVGIVFYPFDVTHKELEWRSNDETIALVDDNGQITGMKLDSTYVVATIKNTTVKDSCLAVVVQPVKGVNILPAGVIRLVKGDATTLHAEIIPADAHNKTVFWNSSNTKAVTVKDNLLTAKAPGEASVTVRTEDGNHTAEVRVTVYEAEHAPQGFSPNGDGVNDYFVCALDNRDTYTLTVFDRSGQVHYRSSNYQNNWDGTAGAGPHAGNKVPAGTYFYTLSAQKSGNVKKGFVVIKY